MTGSVEEEGVEWLGSFLTRTEWLIVGGVLALGLWVRELTVFQFNALWHKLESVEQKLKEVDRARWRAAGYALICA